MKQAVAYMNLQDVPESGVEDQEEVMVHKANAVAADSLWVLAVRFRGGLWLTETQAMSAVEGREHADILLAAEGLMEVLLKVTNLPKQVVTDAHQLRQTLQNLLNRDLTREPDPTAQ